MKPDVGTNIKLTTTVQVDNDKNGRMDLLTETHHTQSGGVRQPQCKPMVAKIRPMCNKPGAAQVAAISLTKVSECQLFVGQDCIIF